MSRSTRVYTEVEVDVDMDDFNDEDLIDELETRGYNVSRKYKIDDIENVIDWYKRGNIKEALIQLEKIVPNLYGISEKVK